MSGLAAKSIAANARANTIAVVRGFAVLIRSARIAPSVVASLRHFGPRCAPSSQRERAQKVSALELLPVLTAPAEVPVTLGRVAVCREGRSQDQVIIRLCPWRCRADGRRSAVRYGSPPPHGRRNVCANHLGAAVS